MTMTEIFDCAVIGGGLLGCFAARNLMRYKLTAVLLEAGEDVCTGLSKANTAIVYPGYDNRPGTLKAELTVRANRDFDSLCRELEVPFSRCGSLMTAEGERGRAVLERKLADGQRSGVTGLELLDADRARIIEPCLPEQVKCALYSPATGTVDPWALCYAAYENAVQNGCTVMTKARVEHISRSEKGYVLHTGKGTVTARAVINCAGLCADRVREMMFPPKVRIFTDAADYMIAEQSSPALSHIIFRETEDGGKGTTAVVTVDGRVLLGTSKRECCPEPSAADCDGLSELKNAADGLISQGWEPIRCFAAPRPNPYAVMLKDGEYIRDGKSINDFVIDRSGPGFISFIGIKTPGLTCADELGKLAAAEIAELLNAEPDPGFDPHRRAIPALRHMAAAKRAELVRTDSAYGRIVCLCEGISEGEILAAIDRGAVTIDGVKRRCGAVLGPCQGSRCRYRIAQLLAQRLGGNAMGYLGEEEQA